MDQENCRSLVVVVKACYNNVPLLKLLLDIIRYDSEVTNAEKMCCYAGSDPVGVGEHSGVRLQRHVEIGRAETVHVASH